MKLNVIREVPQELYECQPTDVHDVLGGPTLIHLDYGQEKTIFISTLLHGNETTSFFVFQKLVNDFRTKSPQKNIIFFIGNTLAASKGMRHLPDQADFNRVWCEGSSPEHQMTKDVLDYVKRIDLFANIDIHNNTGNNPFYGCINKIESEFLHLASIFSKKIVFFSKPSEVESIAFKELCPSVTIEAGVSGVEEATYEVYNFVKKVIRLESFRSDMTLQEVSLFQTIARMIVDMNIDINFNNELTKDALSFVSNLDDHNFNPMIKGTRIGHCLDKRAIRVIADDGEDLTEVFFKFEAGSIVINQIFIPSMFTKDIYVMKRDCLGYVMEKIISV